MSAKVTKDMIVEVHYELKDTEGKTIDKSDEETLVYLHGHGNIVPGLEEALEGKSVGDEVKAKIDPEKGYGERNEELVKGVDKAMFEGAELEVGVNFTADTDDGPLTVVVVEVRDNDVVVDGNHPLAGMELDFTVKIESIRAASEEELAHGHAH